MIEGMIGYLKGEVKDILKTGLILLCGEVGYLVKIPDRSTSEIKIGEKKEFYVYTHVREDTLSLFGFEEKEEIQMFELLISVSGVGPKIALVILGGQKVERVKKAIQESEIDFFTAIPGIGKKNAQRIIVELRSKLGSDSEMIDFGEKDIEVVDALVNWGFTRKQAQEAVKKLDPSLTEQEKIKLALKSIR